MGKHEKESKKHKLSKKHETSSSEEEWIEAELVEKKKIVSSKKKYSSTSNHSVNEISKKIKNQKSKYKRTTSSSDTRKSRNFKKHSKRRYSSSDNSSDENVNRKKRNNSSDKHDNSKTSDSEEQTKNKREEWMNLSTNFSSFSNEDRKKQREHEKKQQKEEEQYNPSKCSMELNPYWRNGGDGLPKFQKPKEVSSDDDSCRYNKNKCGSVKSQSGWRKNKSNPQDTKSNKFIVNKSGDSIPCGSKDYMNFIPKEEKTGLDQGQVEKPLTERELNLLAGKLVKAEIMGNEKLVKELKEKFESGKRTLEEMKFQDEEVLLTQTNRQGYCKPLILNNEYMEGTNHKKQRKKAVDTHKDKSRVKYFPDDDKYSLKQMFENEKFNSANNQDSEFMKIASNIRKNDDLDDLFTDNVRRMKSDPEIQEDSRRKAISEHKKFSDNLDSCPKCIQSTAMQKHLIITIGEYVYLCVPTHEPLLEGHCLIVPVRHVASVTHLDENEWSEIRAFRKALVRLFCSKEQEPIFFEIASGFHRYPHMVLECVPLPKAEGDMAPIYFKKAIDESETEWTQNKKLVSLKDRDVRRAIPKGLSYFSVSFGMEEGLAHVIEDEKLFPRNFAQEIIGGMLDLHHSKWRKPTKQSFAEQSKRVLAFSNEWKEFDCTNTA